MKRPTTIRVEKNVDPTDFQGVDVGSFVDSCDNETNDWAANAIWIAIYDDTSAKLAIWGARVLWFFLAISLKALETLRVYQFDRESERTLLDDDTTKAKAWLGREQKFCDWMRYDRMISA